MANNRWSTEVKQGSDSGRGDKSSDTPAEDKDKIEDDVSSANISDWVAQYQTKGDPDTHRETAKEECQNVDKALSSNDKSDEKSRDDSTSTKT